MSTTTTYTGVRIVDMPDLGAFTNDSSVVGEHAGSGRFSSSALGSYFLRTAGGTMTGPLNVTATSGTVARPVQLNFADSTNVRDFGALGDNTTDDTAAFNAALAAIATTSGGRLYIPSGSYVIRGTLYYSSVRLHIHGDGHRTILIFQSNTLNMFDFAGSDIQLSDFFVLAGTGTDTATGGVLFTFRNANNCAMDRVWTKGGFSVVQFLDDIAVGQGYSTRVTDCEFTRVMNNGIFWSSGFGGGAFVSGTAMLGSPTNNGSGMVLWSGDGFMFVNMNIAAFVNGIYAVPVYLAGGRNYVANIFASNVACDGAGATSQSALGAGWRFDGSAAGTYLTRIHLSSCWGGLMGALGGFNMNNLTDVTLTNCISIANIGNGITLNSPCSDVSIVGCTCVNNSFVSANTYDGIHVVGACTDFVISGCRSKPAGNGITPPADGTGNTQRSGIYIESAASDRYIITNNNLHANIGAGLTDGGTGTSKAVAQNLV